MTVGGCWQLRREILRADSGGASPSLSDPPHTLADAYRLTGDLRSVTYGAFFEATIGEAACHAASPDASVSRYRHQLVAGPWPDVHYIHTGLGKTAPITIAWLYRRLLADPASPRWLALCPPVRLLINQTRDNLGEWVERGARFFERRGLVSRTVSLFWRGRSGTYRQTLTTDSAAGSAGARLGGPWEATGPPLEGARFPGEKSGLGTES